MAAVALKNAMQYSETKPYQASNQVIGQVLGQALGQASMPPPAGRSGTFNQPIDQKALLNNLYNRLEERSKSPHSGFKSVQSNYLSIFSGYGEVEGASQEKSNEKNHKQKS